MAAQDAFKNSRRRPQELLKMADPLGYFEELKTVQPVEGDDYMNLYQNVLIDLLDLFP